MWDDPIVAEVHRVRRTIRAEFASDFQAYASHIRALEAQEKAQGVSYVSLPPRRPESGGIPRHANYAP